MGGRVVSGGLVVAVGVDGQFGDCFKIGVSGLITPGLTAWRERCRDDRDTGWCDEEEAAAGAVC